MSGAGPPAGAGPPEPTAPELRPPAVAGRRLTRRNLLRGGLAVTGLAVLVPSGGLSFPEAAYTDPPGTIEAGFLRRSYAPGAEAALVVTSPARRLWLRVLRVGAERHRPASGLGGVPVTGPHELRWPGGRGRLDLQLGTWPSGLYAVELRDGGGRRGSAPFVVRPGPPGGARSLVVLPTNTWGAYNFRDAATWYADPEVHEVDLRRPFIAGVPPHYRQYDMGFGRWLAQSGHAADVFADDDLEAIPSGEELARRYDLVVFPGHQEYVTEHTYDVIERYQRLGGNLIFLAANNFYYKVVKQDDRMHGRWRWRDLGRPEAALIGAQYVNWYQGIYPNRPLVVVGADEAPWLFAGTGARNGTAFGVYGIEIDATGPDSPPGVQVLALSPDIFGLGVSAQMTHYTSPSGGQVFAPGVLNFGGTAEFPIVKAMLDNLWRRLGPAL